MLSTKFLPIDVVLRHIGDRAKARRLAENLSRKTLATRAGVPESTIKRFELSGRIGLESLALLAAALDHIEDLDLLFHPKPMLSLDQLAAPKRLRGRS